VIGGGAAWFAILLISIGMKAPPGPYNGGLHWQSALITTWEALFSVGVCLGLIVIYRDRLNAQGRLARLLSANAFAVYVLHPPVLVGISRALRAWPAQPVMKFAAVAGITTVAAFAVAIAARQAPCIKRVLQ